MPIAIVVTEAGRAALINADNTGTLPITIAQAGVSATAVVPGEAISALPDEIKRLATIAGEVVADDTLHVSVLDTSADAYTLRSVALYLPDGTLFAIAGQADPILEKAAASSSALAFDIVLEDIDATSITFGDASFSNPPATTERQGVVELATITEALAGIDAVRALTPAGGKAYVDAQLVAAAILTKLITVDGSGSGTDADMLDGRHASDFQLASGFEYGSNANGWWHKMPDGAGGFLLEQCGSIAGGGQGAYAVTFPIAFSAPPAVSDIMLTGHVPASSSIKDTWPQIISSSISATGFTLQVQGSGTAYDYLDGISWRVKSRA